MNFLLSRSRFGYTLIEFIVVLGILVITVGALTIFLTSILKGTNKANISAEVKQNGQVILESLERQIRGAVSVIDKDPAGDSYIMLEREFGAPLHISCMSESPGNYKSRIAVAEIPFPDDPINSDWRSVSNDDIDNGISINNCKLIVSPAVISSSGLEVPAVVSISFTAQRDSDRADLSGKAEFSTTISLRQY